MYARNNQGFRTQKGICFIFTQKLPLLYRLLKIPAKFALLIYCRKVYISNRNILNYEGPILIACNHPNSFLDAIILSTLFKRPIHSLARGDVFKSKFNNALLRSLNILPVYRTSEGVENLEHNYTTFNACKEIFKNNGIVLIFSEGSCTNEWHLRPLMKGTARLAISTWKDGIPLKILPIGVNYQSFTSFGKNVKINSGNIIKKEDVDLDSGYGKSITSFNYRLQLQLQPLVFELSKNNTSELKAQLGVNKSLAMKVCLSLFAAAGYIFHWPLFHFTKKYSWNKGSDNDHYDSILVGLLFGLYPLYLLLATLILFAFTKSFWSFLLLLIAPLCAWSFVQLKKQF